jgi:hypothetical protein
MAYDRVPLFAVLIPTALIWPDIESGWMFCYLIQAALERSLSRRNPTCQAASLWHCGSLVAQTTVVIGPINILRGTTSSMWCVMDRWFIHPPAKHTFLKRLPFFKLFPRTTSQMVLCNRTSGVSGKTLCALTVHESWPESFGASFNARLFPSVGRTTDGSWKKPCFHVDGYSKQLQFIENHFVLFSTLIIRTSSSYGQTVHWCTSEQWGIASKI